MDKKAAYRKALAQVTATNVADIMLQRRQEMFDTRKEFSEILGVQESTVLRTELGRYHFKIENLVEYCTILGLDPAEVVREAHRRAVAEVRR